MKKKISKKVLVALSFALAMFASALPVLASGGGSGSANEAVVSAMSSTAGDMIATGTAILPVALGVVGLILVVTFGIKIFKGVAKK